MSLLRRIVVSGKYFFITCNLSRARLDLPDADFALLAAAIDRVRRRRGFLLPGYVFMPDHWHAIIRPAEADTLPDVMNAIKVASARVINRQRKADGALWQFRYYDRVLRTVKEFHDAIEYMHLNPVQKGLVPKPELWPWSSFHHYGGPGPARLEIDRVELPADESTFL